MALDVTLRNRLAEALKVVDPVGTVGPRLVDDARRLWARVRRLVALDLVPLPADGPERDALELCCYALQLPQRAGKNARPGCAPLRDRCEDAAEQLISEAGGTVDENLLDLAARLLREAPHRPPMVDEAKLLADAINLDDFGLTGIVRHASQLARQGQGLIQLADGLHKRDQYGYWDARLKDDFHFAPVREQARRRLENARRAAEWLKAELGEDEG